MTSVDGGERQVYRYKMGVEDGKVSVGKVGIGKVRRLV